jgi:hypothetical protein
MIEGFEVIEDEEVENILNYVDYNNFYSSEILEMINEKVIDDTLLRNEEENETSSSICVIEKCAGYSNTSCLEHTLEKCFPTTDGCRYVLIKTFVSRFAFFLCFHFY